MSDHPFYTAHGPVSAPGRFGPQVEAVPGSLPSMRTAARGLVFHYRADGDFAGNGIAADRITEIDTRYAEHMLGRILQLSDEPLTRPRPASERLVGCCRDFTLLLVTIARAHGVPGRARVGFATYFHPGWYIDHVIAEIWDGGQRRWRMVDAELADEHVGSDGALVDPEDLTPAQFLTGPAAWIACRSGTADAGRFLVDPGLDIPATRGWPYVRHNLVHDLAALTKREMLLWDNWGWTDFMATPGPGELAVLDELAAATVSSDVPLAQVESFYQLDGLRVPEQITSFSPAHAEPLEVSVPAVARVS